MELYDILIIILIFCGIVFLIALTVAVIQGIIILIQGIVILIDIRHASKELKNKLYTVTSMVDVVSLLIGRMEGAKKRISENSIVAFAAGVKKGLKVLLRNRPPDPSTSSGPGAKEEESRGKDI
ncbi:MAG: hypothetical protein U9R38_08025 [Candidatus Margulisiibacteriota bacterium]|nr:hypothetical protein [Candidatus Margulisiibacteriota bacterium]